MILIDFKIRKEIEKNFNSAKCCLKFYFLSLQGQATIQNVTRYQDKISLGSNNN